MNDRMRRNWRRHPYYMAARVAGQFLFHRSRRATNQIATRVPAQLDWRASPNTNRWPSLSGAFQPIGQDPLFTGIKRKRAIAAAAYTRQGSTAGFRRYYGRPYRRYARRSYRRSFRPRSRFTRYSLSRYSTPGVWRQQQKIRWYAGRRSYPRKYLNYGLRRRRRF